MISQGAHASVLALLSLFNEEHITDKYWNEYTRISVDYSKNSILDDWFNGIYTKICVGVSSEQELLEIYYKAKDADLPVHLVTDVGLTEFHGEATNTCLAIGPYDSDEIDKITGHLKLL